ncbi:hypothetical protein GCM10007415_40310 [Parapedobacter pyrenivorans]|uniref:Uncharacterized protein n=2 Tax=Parapedobacter pyrenivorans TaxID=1305674 RepID=A0A917I052_9SPHI|nr:hypothetical protein GCM10007415_40310 [Parapedobacter pyrenivorans]
MSFSCQQTTKPSQKSKPENLKKIEETSNNFGFYKSFGFCNSKVGYFSQQEADDLYADKIIKIDKKNEIESDAFSAFDEEQWKCIKENLNLKNDTSVKIINTNDDFPFEKLVLIDDNYIVVSRDGYFFTFTSKETL